MRRRSNSLIVTVALTAVLCPHERAAPTSAARWIKGNTHTHTINSDGDSTPDDVVRWNREHGYQFPC